MFNLKKDIQSALIKYPALRLYENGGKLHVEGKFIACGRKPDVEIEKYEVRIEFPPRYPWQFPNVEETSLKIPRIGSRHIKQDNTLCFANMQDDFTTCRNGISFQFFLEEILNPHLCREYVKEKTGHYPTGERSHGIDGTWEGYFDIFKTEDKNEILRQLKLILYHQPLGRNAPCYCNSGKIYKVCHQKLEDQILLIGRSWAVQIFNVLSAVT